MITEVKLAKLSKNMEEAAIVAFSVNIGDEVKKGDKLFEIETDKACVEVESPADGFVRHIFVEPGFVVGVGTTILLLAEKDEDIPQRLLNSLTAAIPPQKEYDRGEVEPENQKSIAEAIRDSQSAAADRQIRLGDTVPLTKLQKITAEKMLESKKQIPCFYLNAKVDVTELVDLRAKLNRDSDVNISYNDFIIKAVAAGLEHFSLMTGRLYGGVIDLAEDVNIGLATSVSGVLYVPVIKQADKKSIVEIASDRARLIEKARRHKLGPEDLEDGCITISNLGSFGVDSFIPIVVPGQCSIIGVGRISELPVPDDGGFVIRKQMSLTIAVDHRIANGSYASEFLDYVREYLEDNSNFQAVIAK